MIRPTNIPVNKEPSIAIADAKIGGYIMAEKPVSKKEKRRFMKRLRERGLFFVKKNRTTTCGWGKEGRSGS